MLVADTSVWLGRPDSTSPAPERGALAPKICALGRQVSPSVHARTTPKLKSAVGTRLAMVRVSDRGRHADEGRRAILCQVGAYGCGCPRSSRNTLGCFRLALPSGNSEKRRRPRQGSTTDRAPCNLPCLRHLSGCSRPSLSLQPPLPENRERFPHPVHRLQREFHRPHARLQPKISLNHAHRIHQHAPAHGRAVPGTPAT